MIDKDDTPEEITEQEKDRVLRTEIYMAERRGKKLSKSELKKKYKFPKNKPHLNSIRTDDLGNIYVISSQKICGKQKCLIMICSIRMDITSTELNSLQ